MDVLYEMPLRSQAFAGGSGGGGWGIEVELNRSPAGREELE